MLLTFGEGVGMDEVPKLEARIDAVRTHLASSASLFVIGRNDPFSMSLLDRDGHGIGLKNAAVSSLLGC